MAFPACVPAWHIQKEQHRFCRESLCACYSSDNYHASPALILMKRFVFRRHPFIGAYFRTPLAAGEVGDVVLIQRPILELKPQVLLLGGTIVEQDDRLFCMRIRICSQQSKSYARLGHSRNSYRACIGVSTIRSAMSCCRLRTALSVTSRASSTR